MVEKETKTGKETYLILFFPVACVVVFRGTGFYDYYIGEGYTSLHIYITDDAVYTASPIVTFVYDQQEKGTTTTILKECIFFHYKKKSGRRGRGK